MVKNAVILFLLVAFYPSFIYSTDESSLLSLKARITSDPNNILSANWTQRTSFCTWTGVTCSRRHHRVTAVDLFNMSLEGTIPGQIGDLSFLTYLDISNNTFTGAIPNTIGNLRRLRFLKFSSNQIGGQIPESLGFLTNLEILDLSNNRLRGTLPRSIFNLSSLQLITVSRNYELTGGLPEEICSFPMRLERLLLSVNQLVGNIPEGLSRCSQLKIISLSLNNFTGSIPVNIGNLSQLQILALGGNQLSGTIPSSIGNLSNMHTLDLSVNTLQEYGSSGLVSTAVDVYSYGILLMETFTKKKPTDEMFLGELSIKKWVSEASSFSDSALLQIVDDELVMNMNEEYSKDEQEMIFASIMRVAIDCASDFREERPNMEDALVRLKKINAQLCGTTHEVRWINK